MPNVSGAKLSDLTGFAWRTVKRRLDDAGIQPVTRERNADLYESREALRALYIADTPDGEALDLQVERARLAKWQADKTEQEVELRAGRMLESDAVTAWVADMIATAKARLVQIPDAVAQHVDAEHSAIVAEQVRRLVYEAMEDLATHGNPSIAAPVVGLDASADVDRVGMGG